MKGMKKEMKNIGGKENEYEEEIMINDYRKCRRR